MDQSNSNSFLQKTNQTWKLYFVLAMAVVSLLFFVAMVISIRSGPMSIGGFIVIDELLSRSLFLLFGLVFLGALFFLIKCPNCKKNLLYLVIKSENASQWTTKILKLTKCPHCKYKP